jgi:cytochrome c-type biogenesis protein CcmH
MRCQGCLKSFAILLWCLCAVCAAWCKEAVPLAEDPVVEQRLIRISEEMRCLVCQNESLAGSRAELAQDLIKRSETLWWRAMVTLSYIAHP